MIPGIVSDPRVSGFVLVCYRFLDGIAAAAEVAKFEPLKLLFPTPLSITHALHSKPKDQTASVGDGKSAALRWTHYTAECVARCCSGCGVIQPSALETDMQLSPPLSISVLPTPSTPSTPRTSSESPLLAALRRARTEMFHARSTPLCPNCTQQYVLQRYRWWPAHTLPQTLWIGITRYPYMSDRPKVTDRLPLPAVLDVSSVVDSIASPKPAPFEGKRLSAGDAEYELVAVLIQRGHNMFTGHNFVYVKVSWCDVTEVSVAPLVLISPLLFFCQDEQSVDGDWIYISDWTVSIVPAAVFGFRFSVQSDAADQAMAGRANGVSDPGHVSTVVYRRRFRSADQKHEPSTSAAAGEDDMIKLLPPELIKYIEADNSLYFNTLRNPPPQPPRRELFDWS